MNFRHLILGFAASLVFVAGAVAQDQEEAPALPDIAPRTVEIRGQLEINFPALERQPLVGFNPPPRIIDLTNRLPYMEPYRISAAELPASPLQPPERLHIGQSGIPRRTGQIEARAGSYLLRHVDARLEHTIQPELAVSGRLVYRGHDGHQPFDFEPDAHSSTDYIEGGADFRFQARGLRGGVGMEGLHSAYDLFGAAGTRQTQSMRDWPLRKGQQLRATTWLHTNEDAPIVGSAQLTLDGASYDTNICRDNAANCSDDDFSRNLRTFGASGSVEVPFNLTSILADAEFMMSGQDRAAVAGTDIMTVDAGLGGRIVTRNGVTVSAIARILHENSSTPEVDRSTIYVSPEVRIDVFPVTGVQIFAENKPSVSHPSLAEIHRENPYIVAQPLLRPEVRTVDARAGVRLYQGPATIDVGVGYMQAPVYRYFEYAPRYPYAEGFSSVNYGEANILTVGGEASFAFRDRMTATLGLEWRNGRLSEDDGDVDIPNVSPITGRAMFAVPLLDNRITLSATGRYESARYRDRLETRELGDYFAVDVSGVYRINPVIGIVLAVENISGGHLERWDRYPQPPTLISGGMRISW